MVDAVFHVGHDPDFEKMVDARQEKVPGPSVIYDTSLKGFFAYHGSGKRFVVLKFEGQAFGEEAGFDDGRFKLADGNPSARGFF
jgi:hypothetical protein